MSAAILPFKGAKVPMLAPALDPLASLPDWARSQASQRLDVIRPGLDRLKQGVTLRAVARWLASCGETESARTYQRWIQDYQRGGLVALAPKHKGRQRKDWGWETLALELYNQPTRPFYSTVAYWLRQQGHEDATDERVRAFLKAVPSNKAETGRKRLGAHFYDQNIKPHVVRDNSVVPVGFVYEGDGHCCDVYVAHPNTGKPFRPELTVWIDIRSHRVVGWWLSEAESAHTTLFSLSHALLSNDHVPGFVHSDPGSGFIARIIRDDEVGFLARFGIIPMTAIAGNARGKGLVEGWFRWFEERFGKTWQTYCGHDRTDDLLSRLSTKIRRGEITLPTLAQYRDGVAGYIAAFNSTPQASLGDQTPDQVWAGLERAPLLMPAEAVMRPRKTCTVGRWSVRFDNRFYRAAALEQFEKRDVIVEYDIHDDARVWCSDLKGRFICEALLVEKKHWLPASRIEEAQQRRLESQRQRHLRHIAEQEARARIPLAADQVAAALDAPECDLPIALTAAPVSDAATAMVAEEISARSVIPETAEARFALWLSLQDRSDVDPALLDWVRGYPLTPECRARQLLRDEFGPNGVNP